jgi:TolB protein
MGTLALEATARALPGRLLFVSDSDIWLLERGQLRPLTPDRLSRQPAWARDGTKVAHVKISTSGSDLWIMDPDGSNSLAMTQFAEQPDTRQLFVFHPVWWPDGSRLVYLTEEQSRDLQVWELDLATRRRQRLLPPIADRLGGVDWPKLSPDGSSLLATSFQPGRGQPGRPQLWTYRLPGGAARQLTETPGGAYDPDWSPDGRHIAYVARAGTRHDVWVMRADGADARLVASGLCRAPTWSPDGRWIAYLSGQMGTFDLWVVGAPLEAAVAGLTEPPAAASAAAPPAPPASGAAPPPPRAVTRGAIADAVSGISWTA